MSHPPLFMGLMSWSSFLPDIKTIFDLLADLPDNLAKIQKILFEVIPAKAGIQSSHFVIKFLDPGFHRGDDFLQNHPSCDRSSKASVFPFNPSLPF
jgi:hypothetical protein